MRNFPVVDWQFLERFFGTFFVSFCAFPPSRRGLRQGKSDGTRHRPRVVAGPLGDFWFGAAFGEHTAAVERRGFLYFDAAMFGTSCHRARSSRRSAGGFGVWRAGAGWEKKEREYGTQGSQVITDLSTN